MTGTEIPDALCRTDAYPHPCDEIRLVETHISWVFLTGRYAYKVKKPVAFGFVDFSTAALRQHFCHEELRCNRPFAAELYIDVVPIVRGETGLRVAERPGASDVVVEWAVKMVQFDTRRQLDNLLDAGQLEVEQMRAFGSVLASQHQTLSRLSDSPTHLSARVQQPALDNFRSLYEHLPDAAATSRSASVAALSSRLPALEEAARALFQRLQPEFQTRLSDGFMRECHGDMHLGNLVLTDRGVRAFDCLEFNATLRWIDVMSDVAFLLMDCSVRHRQDLGFSFLDAYLTDSGDYQGARLLNYFCAYRALVRAKVTAIQLATDAMTDPAERRLLEDRLVAYVDWAAAQLAPRLAPRQGALIVMCGLSGSGKSHLAARLAAGLPALRIRSDVVRKIRFGLAPRERGNSPLDQELYGADVTRVVYRLLAEHAGALLNEGHNVIVDATFLTRQQRSAFESLARAVGVPWHLVWCEAPESVLTERIERRLAQGDDPSDADLGVLAAQRQRFEEPGESDRVIKVDGSQTVPLADLSARLLA